MDTDILLIQKMRKGDERAVEAFVEKYFSRILGYCRSHIGDPGYAEDMAQETFLLEEAMEYPDFQAEDLEQAMDVRMALEALPEELREVAVLYFQQEQKQKDIAQILGIGLPLVKYRIRKIRKWMTEYLEI